MSSFLWIALWSMLLMAGTTIALSVLSKIAIKKNPESSPVFGISGVVFIIGCLFPAVWVALQLNWLPELGVLTVISVGLWLSQYKLYGVKKEVVLWALSVIATLLLPTDLKLFSSMPVVAAYCVLGTSLYVMVRVFMALDHVSGLSMLTLLAQGLLLVMMAYMGLLPKEFLLAGFYVFVVVMSVSQTIKVFSKGYAVLGDYAAAEAGFIVGFIWTYIMAMGYPFVPLVLYSYDIFEVVIAAVMTFMATRHFMPRAVPYLLEKAMASGMRPKKLTRFMFLVLVLTSLLSLLFFSETPVLKNIVIIQGIVLFGTYYMLNGWGTPKPTFRDLTHDLKKGFSDLKEQMKELPLKEKTPPKKTSRKKK